MFVYVCLCLCMSVYVCLCLSMSVYVCLHVYVRVCACVCVYLCMCICVDMYLVHVRICVCVYTFFGNVTLGISLYLSPSLLAAQSIWIALCTSRYLSFSVSLGMTLYLAVSFDIPHVRLEIIMRSASQ